MIVCLEFNLLQISRSDVSPLPKITVTLTVSNRNKHDNASTLYASPTPLLKGWVKGKLMSVGCEDALVASANVCIFFCPKYPS